MAWMHCRSCSTKFAVGLLRCPQCQAMSELYAAPEEVVEAEQEANMPKISVEGGPSNALGVTEEPEAAVEAAAEAVAESAAESEAPAENAEQDAEPAPVVPEAQEQVPEAAAKPAATGAKRGRKPSKPAADAPQA